jgi:hypothetical protein
MGEALDPYNPKQAIRMQAFYMYRIHTKENWTGRLWIDYQVYNGGKTTLYNEYQRAGILNWELMKKECHRKSNFCDINYGYSKKVERYGEGYRRGADRMWYW